MLHIWARADMLETVGGLTVQDQERELIVALDDADVDDADSLRWAAVMIESRLGTFAAHEEIESDEKIIYCAEHDHFPTEGIVTVESEEIGIVVDHHGKTTGYFSDGTFGIPPALEKEVNESDDVYCREHMTECEWRESEN